MNDRAESQVVHHEFPATIVEVPLDGILVESCDELAATLAQLRAVDEEIESNRRRIASGEWQIIPGSRCTLELDLTSIAALRSQLDRVRRRSASPRRTAPARRVPLVRTAPRRLSIRRHRRAARRLQKAVGDDAGPSDPPPLKTVLLVSCAAEALGFAAGLLAATVIP